ncbi:hypothetical protein AAON49_10630 [Pseudotenacibaculum sp. MALMAid0570]|uniref:DUF6980 family protein n=1 Tax=Pseudotenacibaculum sp. MALMAid0570 TaxID=3143938 RepID=UPI0032DF89FB
MTFEEFKKLYDKYNDFDYTKSKWNGEEHEAYVDAMYDNNEFYEWKLIQGFEKKKFPYKDFCCVTMAQRIHESLDDEGEIKHDDYDVVMNKWEDGTFGIPIHDGGTSVIEINFCPWCGTNLKKDE